MDPSCNGHFLVSLSTSMASGTTFRPITEESVVKTPNISYASTTIRHPSTIHSRIPSFIRKLGSGIVLDIRARIPWYLSDWRDAYNYRVVPATALIFFVKYVDGYYMISPLTSTIRQCLTWYSILARLDRDNSAVRCCRGPYIILHGCVSVFRVWSTTTDDRRRHR